MKYSAHVDDFCQRALPPKELWPKIDRAALDYPERMNCAAELLDKMVAAGNGDRTAFHWRGGTWSYEQLLEFSNQVARVLVEDFGIVPGNRLLLRGPNTPTLAACWFAAIKAGAVVVCTMPLLRMRELCPIVDSAQIDLALTDQRIAADCEQAMASVGKRHRVLAFNVDGDGPLEKLAKTKSTRFENCDTAADDIALIAFTSGTTGKCKGTIHFHSDIIAVTDCFPRSMVKPTPEDIFCGSASIAFTYSLGAHILFPMRFGASTVMIENGTPTLLLQGIQDHRATVCFTSPTAYRAMLKQLSNFDISSLKKCVSAGETLPLSTFNAWEKATGIKIIDGIGSTEMLQIFISACEDAIRPGSTGKAIPGYEAKLVDDSGNDVPVGQIGKLAVRGITGCRYLNNPDNQRLYVQNGWNLTGDSYRMDEGGYFWYQARTDDMIISSGYNISGPEVENVLLDHPKVAECAVVGTPDADRGHIVKAFIVLANGVAGSAELVHDLQTFVKAEIAPYKYPRAIEFVNDLPRTATGKLQRSRLRQPETKSGADIDLPEVVQPQEWPRPSGYSNVMTAKGKYVFLAGQIGWNPLTCKIETDDFVAQVKQALRNIVTGLAAAGAGPQRLVRLTWFITDKDAYIAQRREIGIAYREIMGKYFPAMSVAVVSALIEDRAKVEIEATAVVPD